MEVLLWFSPKHGLCQVWSPPDERDQIEKARLRRTESVEKRWKVWLWKQVPKSTASTCVLGFQFATRPADSSAFGVSFSARPKPKGRLENGGSATETKKGKHGETSMQMAPWQDSGFVHPLVSYMRARQGWKKAECCEVVSLLWQTGVIPIHSFLQSTRQLSGWHHAFGWFLMFCLSFELCFVLDVNCQRCEDALGLFADHGPSNYSSLIV